MPPTVADVSRLLRVLAEHDVRFIVVGGVCAVIHGAPVSTFDLDIVPERSDENAARLLSALASVDAVHRDLAGRSIAPDASRLRGPGHNLFMTRSGPLDILGTIGRGRDFAQLESRSRTIDLGDGLAVRVLDLDALIEVNARSRGRRISRRFRSSCERWQSDGGEAIEKGGTRNFSPHRGLRQASRRRRR